MAKKPKKSKKAKKAKKPNKSKKAKKAKKPRKPLRVILLCHALSHKDALAVDIFKVASKVLLIDINELPLFAVGLGQMTRCQLAAQLEVHAAAARMAGWQVLRAGQYLVDDPLEIC